MEDRTTRLFSALGVLVLVWIAVYWSWPVGEPAVRVSFDESELISSTPDDDLPPAPAGTTGADPAASPGVVLAPMPEESAAPGPSAEVGQVVAPQFEPYLIQPGDDYMTISRKVYGTTRHWDAIARANPLLSADKLKVGSTIRIPLDPDNVQGRPADEPSRQTADPAPTIEYTVRSGDTLSEIAKAFYGSIRYTDFLYEANRDRLRSKDSLRLGQVLLIPPLPGGAGED